MDDASDQTSVADRPTLDEEYASLLTAADRVLDEIDRALSRLADGTYGRCVTCGEPIAEQQLSDSPTASTCEQHLPLSSDA